MRFLKQSTAVDVAVGPFLDSADGNTVEGGLTLTQPDIRLKKNGGAWAQKSAAQTLSHEENGWYECNLSTTDTDTLGVLMLAIHESGALQVWHTFHVVTANFYDSLFSTDVFDVSVTQWLGTAAATPTVAGVPEVDLTHIVGGAVPAQTQTGVLEVDLTHIAGSAVSTTTAQLGVNVVNAAGTAWNSGAIGAATLAADTIGASELAADAATEIAAAVWDRAISSHLTSGSFGMALRGLVMEHGTIGATGNTTTALHLAGLTYADDEPNGWLLVIYDVSTDEWHSRVVRDWADTGDLATVDTLPFTPQASTDLYWLLSIESKVDVSHWNGTAVATPTVAGVPEVDVTHWLGTAAATPTVAGVPEVDVTHFGGSAGTFASGRAEVNVSHWDDSAVSAPAVAGIPVVDLSRIQGTVLNGFFNTTLAIGRGTCDTGGTTTSVPTSAFTPSGAAADQFKGRTILFDHNTTTTALRGQQAEITASSNAANPTFTVSTLTTAPASGDTFSVV